MHSFRVLGTLQRNVSVTKYKAKFDPDDSRASMNNIIDLGGVLLSTWFQAIPHTDWIRWEKNSKITIKAQNVNAKMQFGM